jgi:hypothetical protein
MEGREYCGSMEYWSLFFLVSLKKERLKGTEVES